MDSSLTGHLVRIDVTISHFCMTGMRLDEKVMKLSMIMQNNQIPGFLEEPLIRCYPSPYWHPIPYSGKGRPLLKSDKGLPKSVSAYILYNKAPVVLFTPYENFHGLCLLTSSGLWTATGLSPITITVLIISWIFSLTFYLGNGCI